MKTELRIQIDRGMTYWGYMAFVLLFIGAVLVTGLFVWSRIAIRPTIKEQLKIYNGFNNFCIDVKRIESNTKWSPGQTLPTGIDEAIAKARARVQKEYPELRSNDW